MVRSPVYLPLAELERECRFETLRRSGPGGQNRNKVETGVRFYHLSTGLVGEATESRRQIENRGAALERLRLLLALNLRNPPDFPEPFELGAARATLLELGFRWHSRLAGERIIASSESFDYAVLVAEFFDVYAAVDEELGVAAEILAVSSSQIVRLLSKRPQALEALNSLRVKRGLRRLRP